jgi:glutamyl-tRNA synthetase
MGQLTLEQKVAGCLPYLVRAELITEPVSDEQRSFVERLIVALGERLKLLGDIVNYDEFFVADEALAYDEKAFDKRIRKPEDAVPLLRDFRTVLAEATSFEPAALEVLLHRFIEERGINIGQIIHALRVAVTGKAAGPGMFDCLALVGKPGCLTRIDRAVARD